MFKENFIRWPSTKEEALLLHSELSNFLVKCSNSYFQNNISIVSDELYDMLFSHLLRLEKVFSIKSKSTLSVGSIVKGFAKKKHKYRLYSLDNAFSEEELILFEKKIKKYLNMDYIEWIIEPKLDGICLNLIYKDGILVSGLTRGDGIEGEDVTSNVMVIDSIPKFIPSKEYIEIRGEIVIRLQDFDKNKFSTPRNEAGSSIRQIDPSITANRKILFYPHGMMPHIFEDYIELKSFLRSCNFLENKFSILDDILTYTKFSVEDLPSDGIVFKLRDIRLYERLGYNNKAPRYAIAYKYRRTIAVTHVLDIEITVGRTGIVKPVAILEPVVISGSKITRASMHNFNLGIGSGDLVEIKKSGDIIPYIEKIIQNKSQSQYERPTLCPFCKSTLIENGKNIFCRNDECDERKIKKLIYFSNILNLDIGEISIRKLYVSGELKGLEDYFSLECLKENIECVRNNTTYSRFLVSLGINHIGERISEMIALGGIEQDGIGEKIKESYIKNISYIKKMETFFSFKETTIIASPLQGKKILLTGTFSITRTEMKNKLKSRGAIVMNSPSKNIDIIIIGKDPGSNINKVGSNVRRFILY